MKKLLSLILVAAMMLTLCSVSVFAADGPCEEPYMLAGSARIGIYDVDADTNTFVYQYDFRKGHQVYNDAVAGVTYDLAANTLTLDNADLSGSDLNVYYMGDDFKVEVKGACALGSISVYNYFSYYNTNLSLIGTGALTVNGKKENDDAILMMSGGDAPMAVSIADSLTVDLYAGDGYVINIDNSSLADADKVITAGGKPVEGVETERVIYREPEEAKVAIVTDSDRNVSHGTLVKSKSDPAGLYAVEYNEWNPEKPYGVTKYLYVPAVNNYAVDESYSGSIYVGGQLTEEEFNAEFTYEMATQPVNIRYTTEERERNRGWQGVQLRCAADPEGVYVGSGYWAYDSEYGDEPEGYYIYKLYWSEDEQIYREDNDFDTLQVTVGELAEKGFNFVYEETEQQLKLECWSQPAPYGGDNWKSSFDVMERASDPEGFYVRTGTYSDSEGETGISIHRVFYDPENDVHYVNIYDYSKENYFAVPDEAMASGDSEFSYAFDTVTSEVTLRYIDDFYDYGSYSTAAVLLSRDDEPGALYAYDTWVRYVGGEQEEMHSLVKLTFNEENGHYYAVEMLEGEITSEEIATLGYKTVCAEQPMPFITKGNLMLTNYPVYKDNDGNSYIVYWDDTVYSISDNDTVTINDTAYYIAQLDPDVDPNSLISTEHDVESDYYRHRLPLGEYHHQGSGVAPSGSALTGTVTSFGDENNAVTVELMKDDKVLSTSMGKGNTAQYAFRNIPDGTYTLRFSKTSHATRTYEVTVSGDTVQDAKIHLMGDISGDGAVKNGDYSRILAYLKGTKGLSDYEFACADISGDGAVKNGDLSRVLAYLKGTKPLW